MVQQISIMLTSVTTLIYSIESKLYGIDSMKLTPLTLISEVASPAVGHWCPDLRPGTHHSCIFTMIKTLSILNAVPVVITWHYT